MFTDRRPTFPQPTDSTFVLTFFQRDYIKTKKVKIPNYDPGFSKSSYKQDHPCMQADVLRMLIYGHSNSGKTNILLHMLYKLLVIDKIYLFSKNLQQNKYQALLQDFAEKINPRVQGHPSVRFENISVRKA